jgi:hypothetical protein
VTNGRGCGSALAAGRKLAKSSDAFTHRLLARKWRASASGRGRGESGARLCALGLGARARSAGRPAAIHKFGPVREAPPSPCERPPALDGDRHLGTISRRDAGRDCVRAQIAGTA